jgi:hypothetical protein
MSQKPFGICHAVPLALLGQLHHDKFSPSPGLEFIDKTAWAVGGLSRQKSQAPGILGIHKG